MNIEKLLDSSGNLNAAFLRWSKNFEESEEYKYIVDHSHDLDIFENVSFSMRFWFVYNNMHLSNCRTCGKPRICFDKLQRCLRLCNHKQNITNFKNANKLATAERNEQLAASIANKSLFLNDNEFNEKIESLSKKSANYAFMVSKDNMNFYHDLVLKTIDLIPFDDKANFRLSERFFIIKNDISKLPTCKFCGKPVVFVNRFIGYRDNCKECEGLKINEWRAKDNEQKILNSIDNSKYELISIPKLMNKDQLVVKCKKCGYISEWSIINGMLKNFSNIQLCKNCEHVASHKEEDLVAFIKENYNGKIIHKKDSRKIIPPYELDVYLPDLNLAFEFDGLYWHSVKSDNDKNYHLKKTIACEAQNIQLIHIFENEWDHKENIVKSRILNLLSNPQKTIFARKCKIEEIDSKTSKQFQEQNHIQGCSNASKNIGLFFNGELVSLMTFSKPRFNKKYEWELVRFCNKLGHHIPGAASKLLAYFEKTYHPESLISYADRRWSIGNLYEKLGFDLDHVSKPDYWYFNKSSVLLESRIKYQKHKLCKILEKFDPNLSEYENMKNNGYSRIFDCGNLVYVKTY